jgi:hypothetical protein
MDLAKRQEAINQSVRILQDEVLVIPLHRQVSRGCRAPA